MLGLLRAVLELFAAAAVGRAGAGAVVLGLLWGVLGLLWGVLWLLWGVLGLLWAVLGWSAEGHAGSAVDAGAAVGKGCCGVC